MTASIVVGLNGSESAHAALRWALDFAASSGRTVRVVHVWRVESAEIYVPVTETRNDGEHAARTDASRWFQEATGRHLEDTPATLDVVEGAAAGPMLVSVARDADLLVIGTPEHRALGRLLHGSVSHYVLSHAACPVVAVPLPAPEPVSAFPDPTARQIGLPDVQRS